MSEPRKGLRQDWIAPHLDADPYTPAVNLNQPRMAGKTLALKKALDAAVASGHHVHRVDIDGVECFNGPDDCAYRELIDADVNRDHEEDER